MGLTLNAPPAISRKAMKAHLLGSIRTIQYQRYYYNIGFSPGNRKQQSAISSWQELVKKYPTITLSRMELITNICLQGEMAHARHP